MQIKRLLGAILAFVALSAGLGYSHHWTYQRGIVKGIDIYHDICYNTPGIVVDEQDGTMVACQGLTQLPEPERKIFLDKGREV